MRKACFAVLTVAALLALVSASGAYPRTVLVEDFTNWG